MTGVPGSEKSKKFINSIFLNQQRVYKELSKTKEGKKALIEIYGIKNIDGYPSLK